MNELISLGQKVVADVLAQPTILLGLVVLVILMIRDFKGVALPLIQHAIERAEVALRDQAGEEKLRMAVDFVVDFLPLPYRLLVPRPLVVSLVKSVFAREYAPLFQNKKVASHMPAEGEQGPN